MTRLKLFVIFGAAILYAAQNSLAGESAPADQQANPSPGQSTDQSTDQPVNPSTDQPANQPQPCVDVEIGGDRSAYFKCLNEQIQKKVEHEHGTPQPTAPIDAQSPSNQVGTANDAAAREKMGNAFGKSATPQRPPKPVFNNPLLPH
jgi:hypothetical protein